MVTQHNPYRMPDLESDSLNFGPIELIQIADAEEVLGLYAKAGREVTYPDQAHQVTTDVFRLPETGEYVCGVVARSVMNIFEHSLALVRLEAESDIDFSEESKRILQDHSDRIGSDFESHMRWLQVEINSVETVEDILKNIVKDIRYIGEDKDIETKLSFAGYQDEESYQFFEIDEYDSLPSYASGLRLICRALRRVGCGTTIRLVSPLEFKQWIDARDLPNSKKVKHEFLLSMLRDVNR